MCEVFRRSPVRPTELLWASACSTPGSRGQCAANSERCARCLLSRSGSRRPASVDFARALARRPLLLLLCAINGFNFSCGKFQLRNTFEMSLMRHSSYARAICRFFFFFLYGFIFFSGLRKRTQSLQKGIEPEVIGLAAPLSSYFCDVSSKADRLSADDSCRVPCSVALRYFVIHLQCAASRTRFESRRPIFSLHRR